MAITLTTKRSSVEGDRQVHVFDVLLDNSYPTGGYALTPKTLGFTSGALLFVSTGIASGYAYDYDYTNQKLKLYVVAASPSNSALSEVPNATNLSTVTIRLKAIGT